VNGSPLTYSALARDCGGTARLGRVTTRHGVFDTPAFMPVGTQGTIKGIVPETLSPSGTQIVLANTYHLMLRPGEKTVAALGDLHGLMAWDGPILTDSGGFQVFSLADRSRLDDNGVEFKSHIDGAIVDLTPQRSIQVQNDLGADIIMCLDDCPPADAMPDRAVAAVGRTLKWAQRCKEAHARPGDQALFAIVQGGTDPVLRQRCRDELAAMDFDGYALGGLAVGEGYVAMRRVLDEFAPTLPADRPRYLMGVGYPRDIVAGVMAGIDMFDCVLPTRNGRNAYAFTAGGAIRLRNAQFAADAGPIEADCACPACRRFSRGAIRHFFFADEMLGPVLVSLHNIWFYQRLMSDIRRAIATGTMSDFAANDPRSQLGPSEG
jgi:queuine tRNA-ribosyltransferase